MKAHHLLNTKAETQQILGVHVCVPEWKFSLQNHFVIYSKKGLKSLLALF